MATRSSRRLLSNTELPAHGNSLAGRKKKKEEEEAAAAAAAADGGGGGRGNGSPNSRPRHHSHYQPRGPDGRWIARSPTSMAAAQPEGIGDDDAETVAISEEENDDDDGDAETVAVNDEDDDDDRMDDGGGGLPTNSLASSSLVVPSTSPDPKRQEANDSYLQEVRNEARAILTGGNGGGEIPTGNNLHYLHCYPREYRS